MYYNKIIKTHSLIQFWFHQNNVKQILKIQYFVVQQDGIEIMMVKLKYHHDLKKSGFFHGIA